MSKSHPYKEGDEPIPGYRLVAFLGRGGYGEVWKATAPGGTHLAIKVIPLGGATGRKELRALRLVRGVRHPNLVPLIAFWLKDKHGDLVDDSYTSRVDLASSKAAEFFARQTMAPPTAAEEDPASPDPTELILAMGLGQMSLFERLDQSRQEPSGGVPDDELLAYMRDAARAIDYLNRPIHDLGHGLAAIQHCDIKPHNMLVVGGALQLCDFGLASILGDVRTTSAAAGTIAYAAPECLIVGKPSAATDQYSLAVSYYELKTGELPFENETFAHVSSSVINGKLNLSGLRSAQRKVLRRATALDPSKRYPTTTAMVNALTEAAQADARGSGRRRLPLIIFLLLVAIGSGGGLVYLNRDQLFPSPNPSPPDENNQVVDTPPIIPAPTPTPAPVPPPPISSEEQARTQLAQAQGAFDEKEYSVTVDQLSKLINDFGAEAPDVVIEARLLRGKAELKQSHFDAAIADFEQLKAVNATSFEHLPELGSARFARGIEKLNAHDFTAAMADFLAAREVDSQQYGDRAEVAQALIGRGRLLLGEGNFTDAIANLTSAIDQHANFAQAAYAPRGRCWLRLKEYGKALADLNQAIDTNPDDAGALLDRGQIRLDQQDYPEALQDLDRAIELKDELNNEVAIAYQRRGTTRMLLETDLPGAISDFSEVIQLKPNAQAHIQRGLAYQRTKQFDQAIQDFDDATKLDRDPLDADQTFQQAKVDAYRYAGKARYEKAESASSQGDVDTARRDFTSALRDFDAAIQLAPDNAELYLNRGEIQAKPAIARYREALADYDRAKQLTPKDPTPYRLIGWLLSTCPDKSWRNTQQAIDAATTACRMTKFEDARCLDALAAVNADMGLFERAAGLEETAIKFASGELKSKFEQRLALYRQKKPFRVDGAEPETN